MSATETALRVLYWTFSHTGPFPHGDLGQLEALATPAPEVRAFVTNLANACAARLSLSRPPFGDTSALGSTPIWLAAAAGAGSHPQAVDLVRCCRAAARGWDLVARHAVVAPLVTAAAAPASFCEELLLASPLTQLLWAPGRGEYDATISTARQLLGHRDAERLLVATLAAPTDIPAVLSWRGALLGALWNLPQHQSFVLDVFECAVALHSAEWCALIDDAFLALAQSEAMLDGAGDEPALRARSIGAFWEPLRSIRRARLEWIRKRRYLDFETYLYAIRLAAVVSRLQGEGN